MNILRSTCCAFVTSIFLLVPAYANTTYIVQEGDTAKTIAKTYLGSEDAGADLMAFNQLRAEDDLKPGTVLSLPIGLQKRTQKLAEMTTADLSAAKQAQADVYAKTEFDALASTATRAAAAKQSGDLGLAHTLIAEMPSLRETAIEAANIKAIVPGQASILRSSGTIEISSNNGITWNAIDATSLLRKGDRIRSQKNSKAVLTFPNGIEVEMDPLSAFKVVSLHFDKRDSAHDIKLRLELGEILGKMKPMERKKPMKIETGRASIAVRGSTVLASTGPGGVLRGSNFAGKMDIELDGQVVVFEPGEGVVASQDGLVGPVKLPAVPVLVGQHAGNFTTGSPRVHFDVDTQNPDAASRHKLEVSTDAQFTQIAHSQIAYGERLETGALDQGTYFYRVAALDDNNLQGPQFAQGSFEIVEAPALRVDTKAPHREAGGMLIAAKGVTYQASVEGADEGQIEWIVNDELIATPNGALMLDEDGFYEMKVSSSAGEAGAERLSVYVDAKGPKIRVHLSDPFGNPAQNATVRGLTILGEDTTGVDSITASVNGGPSESVGDLPLVLDASVANRVEIQAEDLWGNRSSRTVDVPAANIIVPRVQKRPAMPTIVREPVTVARPAPSIPVPSTTERLLVPDVRRGNWFQRFLGITPKERLQRDGASVPPSSFQAIPVRQEMPIARPSFRSVESVNALPSAPSMPVPVRIAPPAPAAQRVLLPETKKTPFLNRVFGQRRGQAAPSMQGTSTMVPAGTMIAEPGPNGWQVEPARQFAPNGVPLARLYSGGFPGSPVISRSSGPTMISQPPAVRPTSSSGIVPSGPPVIQSLPIPPGFDRSTLRQGSRRNGSMSRNVSRGASQSDSTSTPSSAPVVQSLPIPPGFKPSGATRSTYATYATPTTMATLATPTTMATPANPSRPVSVVRPAAPAAYMPSVAAPSLPPAAKSVPVIQPMPAPPVMSIPPVNVSPALASPLSPLSPASSGLKPQVSPPPPVSIPAASPISGDPAAIPFGEREIIPEPVAGSGKTLLERLLKE